MAQLGRRTGMKAIAYEDYGSPDVLEVREVRKPEVARDEVLVQVRAASANPYDWHFMRGVPYIARLMATGLRKPKQSLLGSDVAGEVEAVGDAVTRFRPGDEVFGFVGAGGFAEFVSAPERLLALKPANLSFEQAATVPLAAVTALQGLRDAGELQSGQKVLIVGASGGVGTFAVQIARALGADVTAVCSPRNVDAVRSLGAHRVIDYTREDFTESGELYDVLIDIAGSRSLSECRRVLQPAAIFVMVGAAAIQHKSEMKAFGHFAGTRLRSMRGSQRAVFFIAKLTHKDMEAIAELMAAGKVTPAIDRRYRLDELADAFAYFNEGHARGKIALEVTRSAAEYPAARVEAALITC